MLLFSWDFAYRRPSHEIEDEKCLLKGNNFFLITDNSGPEFLVVQRSTLSLTVILFYLSGDENQKNVWKKQYKKY